ncbi:MAG: hypothetical protein RBU37_00550 [Myxococcota bacterium]|nr:hypothetical protein [Myxococcota bacterium]
MPNLQRYRALGLNAEAVLRFDRCMGDSTVFLTLFVEGQEVYRDLDPCIEGIAIRRDGTRLYVQRKESLNANAKRLCRCYVLPEGGLIDEPQPAHASEVVMLASFVGADGQRIPSAPDAAMFRCDPPFAFSHSTHWGELICGSPQHRAAIEALLEGPPSAELWQELLGAYRGWDGVQAELHAWQSAQHLAHWPRGLRASRPDWLRWEQPQAAWWLLEPLTGELELSGCPLCDEGFDRIWHFPALSQPRALALRDCKLSAASVQLLAQSERVRDLQRLDLSHNPIGTEGLLALAGSPYLQGLRSLKLSACGISTEGIEAVATAPVFAGLRCLVLTANPADEQRSLQALWCSPTLRGAQRRAAAVCTVWLSHRGSEVTLSSLAGPPGWSSAGAALSARRAGLSPKLMQTFAFSGGGLTAKTTSLSKERKSLVDGEGECVCWRAELRLYARAGGSGWTLFRIEGEEKSQPGGGDSLIQERWQSVVCSLSGAEPLDVWGRFELAGHPELRREGWFDLGPILDHLSGMGWSVSEASLRRFVEAAMGRGRS